MARSFRRLEQESGGPARRIVAAVTTALVLSGTIGCDTAQPTRPATATSPAQALASDVDPARAFLKLDQVPPPVSKPNFRETPPLSERGARQLAKARTLISEQRFAEAVIELERAQRFDPNHPLLDAALASLQWQTGNAERARSHARAAVSGNPNLAEGQYILGRCAAQSGATAEAIAAYRAALLCSDIAASELEPPIRFHLAESLTRDGYLTAALEQYEWLAGLAPATGDETGSPSVREMKHASRQSRALLLERLGRFSEAADVLADESPPSAQRTAVAAKRARLLARAGRTDDALRIARDLPPEDPGSLELLREIHAASATPDRLFDDLRLILSQGAGASAAALMLADGLESSGRAEEAVAELRRYVSAHPEDDAVRLRLADLLFSKRDDAGFVVVLGAGVDLPTRRIGDYDERIRRLAREGPRAERLLEPGSGSPAAGERYVMGALSLALGRSDRAEKELGRCLELRPDLASARRALTSLLFEQLRYADALRVARGEGDELPEDADLALLVGRVQERLDNHEEAERAFRLVTQLDRDRVEAMFELARIYSRTDRKNLAQRQLQILLERQPDHEEAREFLALMFMEDGKADVAYAQIEELKRRSGNPATIARCDSVLDPSLRRDPTGRRGRLLDAIEKTGGDAVSWNAVAQTYDEFEAAEARAAYSKALTFDPHNETALRGAVDACRGDLDFEAAAGHLETLLKIRPNRHAWRQEWVVLWLTLQDFDRALDIARSEAARTDTAVSVRRTYRLHVLEALRRLKRPDAVLAELRAWTNADPEDVEAAKWLGDELLDQDRAAEAAEVFEALVGRDDRNWTLLGAWVDALGKTGRLDAAAQRTLDRFDQDRENDTASYVLVALLANGGQSRVAMEYAAAHLLRTLNREAFQEFMVERLRQETRDAEAVDYLERLMNEATTLLRATREARRPLRAAGSGSRQTADQPNDPFTMESLTARIDQLRVSLGLALVGAKRARDAEERVSRWLESSEDGGTRARMLWLLALTQRAQRDEDAANETIRRALALAPDNVSLNNDVAYGWINAGERLDEAERMIRFALSRSPRESAYLDTYGWLLYKKARFQESKLWLERARRANDGDDPVLLDHLGDACWRLGEKEEAVAHWRKSAELILQRKVEELIGADDRRVRDQTPKKLEAVNAGSAPALAPLAKVAAQPAP